MNTRFANDVIDGFWSFHAMLLSAAKSPLSRPDDLRWVKPESEGPGEWIMAYSRPTSLRVPLSSVMEWVGKKSLAEIIRDDPRFEMKKLPSDRSANELAVNIYFAWKPDSLQLDDTVDSEEEEPQPVVTHNKARKTGRGRGGRGGKGGRTARAPPESPQKRKQAAGARTRTQGQVEEVVVKQESADMVVVKKEDDSDGDLPNINDIINGRS
jgi:hypothetical protein